MRLQYYYNCFDKYARVEIRDGGLEDRGRPWDLILMASVSVLVSAAHVSISVLVSEVPASTTTLVDPKLQPTNSGWSDLYHEMHTCSIWLQSPQVCLSSSYKMVFAVMANNDQAHL